MSALIANAIPMKMITSVIQSMTRFGALGESLVLIGDRVVAIFPCVNIEMAASATITREKEGNIESIRRILKPSVTIGAHWQ